MMRSSIVLVSTIFALAAAACDGGGDGTAGSGATGTGGSGATGTGGAGGAGGAAACDELPTEGVYATFQVAGAEIYHASITNPTGIQQAIDLWTGQSTANIPIGDLVCQPAPWNCPWSFYQDPATLQFAEVTIELCDGTPSLVEENCPGFGGGQFCPWSAELVELRDCRTDPACPIILK